MSIEMTMKREYAIGLAFAVLVIVSAVGTAVALITWGSDGSKRTAAEFRAACTEARGNAVWNGRYWECLR
jgi:ABC-type transporter Mla subunit MlaD